MKHLLLAAVLVSLPLISPGVLAEERKCLKEHEIEELTIKVANETVQGGYKLLSVGDLKKMLEAKEDFLLVDAHPKEEFDLAYVAGANNFGFESKRTGKWEQDAKGASQESYKALLGSDLNRKIVIYCGFNKCGRSHSAATWARQFGYTNVHRVPGGVTAWKDAGFDYKANK